MGNSAADIMRDRLQYAVGELRSDGLYVLESLKGLKSHIIIQNNILKSLLEKLDKQDSVNKAKLYQTLSKELNEVDDNVTIVKASIMQFVVDETMHSDMETTNADSSHSFKLSFDACLNNKMRSKAESIKVDIDIVTKKIKTLEEEISIKLKDFDDENFTSDMCKVNKLNIRKFNMTLIMLKAMLIELGELRILNANVAYNMSELNSNIPRNPSNLDSVPEVPLSPKIKCNVQKCDSPIRNMIVHLKEEMESQIGNELNNEPLGNKRPTCGTRGYHDGKAGFDLKELETVKVKMGEYAIPFREGALQDYCMVFDSGTPSKFWLYADTPALAEMQQIIQRVYSGDNVRKSDVGNIKVGSLILARYPIDQNLYRARIEDIIEEEFYVVRYIDYGNLGDNLSKHDLYPWEPHLEMIPPQAVQCCFADPSKCLKSMETLNPEEMDKFKSVMNRASPMQMIVHRRHTPTTDIWNMEFHSTDPDLTVSLVSKDKKRCSG